MFEVLSLKIKKLKKEKFSSFFFGLGLKHPYVLKVLITKNLEKKSNGEGKSRLCFLG